MEVFAVCASAPSTPITNQIITLINDESYGKIIADTAMSVANECYAQVTKTNSFEDIGELESVFDNITKRALGYVFDGLYCDTNSIPYCDNCIYEWANNFWAQIYSFNRLVTGIVGNDAHVIKTVYHNDNLTALILANDVPFYFEHNCENQKLPVNETEKRFTSLVATEAA